MANYKFEFVCGSTEAYIYFEGPRPTHSEAADYIVFETASGKYIISDYVELDVYTDVVWDLELYDLNPNTKYTVRFEYDGVIFEEDFTTNSDKPSFFEWSIEKESGKAIRLSASEWNAFTDKINEYLEYRNKSTINFTRAKSAGFTGRNVGTAADGLSLDSPKVISKKILCEAVDALNTMLSSDEKIAYPTGISAGFLNKIAEKLNSIE